MPGAPRWRRTPSRYTLGVEPTKYVWMDGALVPWEEATVHVLSHALHYGTGVFEGIRAYRAEEGTAVFRLTDHMERLHRSAKAYSMDLEWSVADLTKAARGLLVENGLDSGYIRPLVFLELGAVGLNPTSARVRTAIICWEWGAYLGEEGLANGIRVAVSSWRRFSTDAFPNAKATGTYINSILAKVEALKAGYDEAIMLNPDGLLSEGSGENLFVVPRRRGVHTAGIGRLPRRHHPKLGDDAARRRRSSGGREGAQPVRPLLLRRALHDRDRRRGDPDPRDRRPGGRGGHGGTGHPARPAALHGRGHRAQHRPCRLARVRVKRI